MHTPNPMRLGRLPRRALYVLATCTGIWGCSADPVSPPVGGAPSSRDFVVNLPDGRVTAGDTVWMSIELKRPCWNEQATAELTVVWDAPSFDLHHVPGDVSTEALATGTAGRMTLHLVDRDGFGSGIRIPFVARVDAEIGGFRVEGLVVACGGPQMAHVYD